MAYVQTPLALWIQDSRRPDKDFPCDGAWCNLAVAVTLRVKHEPGARYGKYSLVAQFGAGSCDCYLVEGVKKSAADDLQKEIVAKMNTGQGVELVDVILEARRLAEEEHARIDQERKGDDDAAA